MGLDTPNSLAQEFASALTLTTTTTESPPQYRLSLWKVFSIPELVNAIAQYLNTSQLLKLGLVSKTFSHIFQPQLSLSLLASVFHDPPYGPPGTNPILPDAFRRLAPRVDALTLDLFCFQDILSQNAMLETVYEHSAVPLRRLRITYWGEELGVLEELLTRLPNLTDLSVTFKSSSDATAFPMMLIRVGRARQGAAAAVERNTQGSSRQQDDTGGGLKSLAIELGVPKVMAMNISVLSELVQVWPALMSLELACISLQVNHPARPSLTTAGVATPPPPPPPPPPIGGPVPPQTVAAATTTALLPLPTAPPSHSADALEEPSFPRMKSLTLTGCPLESLSLRALDRLFPSLQELELCSCPGNWYRTLAGVRTSQIGTNSDVAHASDVPFIRLRRLNIWVKYQSARDKILGIVKDRPYLTCVGTDILPDSRDGILEVAAFCSGVEVNELVGASSSSVLPLIVAAESSATASADVSTSAGADVSTSAGAGVSAESSANAGANASEGDAGVNTSASACASINTSTNASTATADMSKVRNRIKRLAIQTYASPPHNMDVIERFYNAPAFRHLEYVYMQNRKLSMTLFPFAKTLRELNLGGQESPLLKDEIMTLNSILHQLPVLEVLKLDRYVDGVALSKLFQGFGREPDFPFPQDVCKDEQASNTPVMTKSHGEEGKLSCLRKLRLVYGGLGHKRLSLDSLKSFVLNRFVYLEKLTVRSAREDELPRTEDIFQWRKVLSGETSMGEGEDGGSLSSSVTKCRVVFKLRSQTTVSVVL
ncbi:hypothetical protein BG015_011385 [Linnemannia schmuckeri]|uniref:F-box domain-containing protein n=1 Tax=Linnemannia schmuckeri TaxID=64567 RepID=A0A9P5RUT9_9FUNG|nr:hypothetical protein BG015_011385 [Linnemannia schmuckeri]